MLTVSSLSCHCLLYGSASLSPIPNCDRYHIPSSPPPQAAAAKEGMNYFICSIGGERKLGSLSLL